VIQLAADEHYAIQITTADAMSTYRDRSLYRVEVRETKSNWYIDFKLKSRTLNAGGPAYIVGKRTGKILKRTYWQ